MSKDLLKFIREQRMGLIRLILAVTVVLGHSHVFNMWGRISFGKVYQLNKFHVDDEIASINEKNENKDKIVIGSKQWFVKQE